MISTGEYKRIISELLDELPEEFFNELSGGVIVSNALRFRIMLVEMTYSLWDSIRCHPE